MSKAADMLGLTQPAVSVQVKALESAHGMRLFRRQGRDVILTDTGHALFELTRQMFLAEERIGEFLTDTAALDAGSLTLAADGPHIALDLISTLVKRHPRLDVSVRLGNTSAALQMLLEQRADAAIVANPEPSPRLVILPIHRRGMLALLPPDHPLAARDRLSLQDVVGYSVVLREPGSTTRRILDKAVRRLGIALTPVLELGSREAMREAVARGLGIGFLFERESEGDERTVARPIEGLSDVNVDTLVCLRSNRHRAVVRALVTTAGELADAAEGRTAETGTTETA